MNLEFWDQNGTHQLIQQFQKMIKPNWTNKILERSEQVQAKAAQLFGKQTHTCKFLSGVQSLFYTIGPSPHSQRARSASVDGVKAPSEDLCCLEGQLEQWQRPAEHRLK